MHYISLLSQSGKIREIVKESATPWIGLFAFLLLMIFILHKLRARFRDSADTEANPHLMLTQIGELRREGDLSEEEFRSIKNRLIRQIEQNSTEPDSPDRKK